MLMIKVFHSFFLACCFVHSESDRLMVHVFSISIKLIYFRFSFRSSNLKNSLIELLGGLAEFLETRR